MKKVLRKFLSAVKKSNSSSKPREVDWYTGPFDSEWYLENNPDVKEAGIDPLLHYSLHGLNEGRSPVRHNPADAEDKGVLGVRYYANRLWSGFSHIALPRLNELAQSENVATCSLANRFLSRWYYAHGEIDRAIDCIYRSVEARDQWNKHNLVGLSKCYLQQGQFDKLRQIVNNQNISELVPDEVPYLLANCADRSSPSEITEALNRVYQQQEFAPLKFDPDVSTADLSKLRCDVNYVTNIIEGPLVSIIIPCYNAADSIHIALDSLLAQTWKNIEIVVVDDCSSDNSTEVIEQYCDKDSRVRLIRNEQNLGAYPTRNRGMQAAKGDFLTVHDSDDWSHCQKIEAHVKPLISDRKLQSTVSYWIRVRPELYFLGSWYLNQTFLERNHSSAMFRRETIDAVGLWDEVNVAGDTEYLWRIESWYGKSSVKHIHSDVPLSFALELETSLTRTKATHVKTIHYGLRRVYRESARWWHRANNEPVMTQAKTLEERVFPVPIGNSRLCSREFDVLVMGDWSSESYDFKTAVARLSEILNQDSKVALMHCPSFFNDHKAPIADEVFNLAGQHGISFAHPGIELKVKTLKITHPRALERNLDALPTLFDCNEVDFLLPYTTEADEHMANTLLQRMTTVS